MSAPPFPESIAACFAADARGPVDVVRGFTPEGVVKDERSTHTGRGPSASSRIASLEVAA